MYLLSYLWSSQTLVKNVRFVENCQMRSERKGLEKVIFVWVDTLSQDLNQRE